MFPITALAHHSDFAFQLYLHQNILETSPMRWYAGSTLACKKKENIQECFRQPILRMVFRGEVTQF